MAAVYIGKAIESFEDGFRIGTYIELCAAYYYIIR